MQKIGVFLLLSVLAIGAELRHFPKVSYHYQPGIDIGFGEYLSPDLYGTRRIVLTYDDGPHPVNTPKILDLLKQYGAKATFFVMGERINDRTMPIIERILAEGHYLASHDWDHDNNNSENYEQYRTELRRSMMQLEDIEQILGLSQNPVFYRFPYGAYGRNKLYHHINVLRDVSFELYGKNCINFAFWDIDTADWVADMSPQNIAENIYAHVDGGTAYSFQKQNGIWVKKPYTINEPIGGGVVLLHDIHSRTVEATAIFLEGLKQRDIEIVPLTEGREFRFPFECELLSI